MRDPRAIYASRRRLASPFGLPAAATRHTDGGGGPPSEPQAAKHTSKGARMVRAWAHGLCGATQRDTATGQSLGAASYEYIDYSSFVRRPRQLVEQLYRRHFGRPVPREVLRYIAKHLPQARRNATSSPQSWQFQYGTEARDVDAVDQRWQRELRQQAGHGSLRVIAAITSADTGDRHGPWAGCGALPAAYQPSMGDGEPCALP